MLDQRQAKRDVFVLDGTFGLVGRLDGIHIDPDGEAWGTVHCGTFGARTRLVPLRGAPGGSGDPRRGPRGGGGSRRIACPRHQAPPAREPDDSVLLGIEDAETLREHYST